MSTNAIKISDCALTWLDRLNDYEQKLAWNRPSLLSPSFIQAALEILCQCLSFVLTQRLNYDLWLSWTMICPSTTLSTLFFLFCCFPFRNESWVIYSEILSSASLAFLPIDCLWMHSHMSIPARWLLLLCHWICDKCGQETMHQVLLCVRRRSTASKIDFLLAMFVDMQTGSGTDPPDVCYCMCGETSFSWFLFLPYSSICQLQEANSRLSQAIY